MRPAAPARLAACICVHDDATFLGDSIGSLGGVVEVCVFVNRVPGPPDDATLAAVRPMVERAALALSVNEAWAMLACVAIAGLLLTAAVYDGLHHVFNVGGGIGRNVLEVVTDIAEVLGRPDVVPIHKPGRATDVPVNVLDIALIRREFGWSPVLEEVAPGLRFSQEQTGKAGGQ